MVGGCCCLKAAPGGVQQPSGSANFHDTCDMFFMFCGGF